MPSAAKFAVFFHSLCRPPGAKSCRMNLLAQSGCARRFAGALSVLLLSTPVLAINDNLRAIAETYVRNQTRGLPGEVAIQIGQLDATSQLPACSNIQAFTPNGSRLWGKSYVGIRCLAPQAWNVLIPVQVSVISDYLVTARPLAAGQPLQASDFAALRGDLSALPPGVVTDRNAVAGKTLKNGLGAGQPLRQDLLLAPLLVRSGQTVKLISSGPGFTASGEGRAVNNAAEGQVAQVRVPSGQTISGIVLPDGTVEVGR